MAGPCTVARAALELAPRGGLHAVEVREPLLLVEQLGLFVLQLCVRPIA
jgi:hypothetical protein